MKMNKIKLLSNTTWLLEIFKIFKTKKTSCSGVKRENMSVQELSEELHKPIIRKFMKIKIQSPFVDNIWGTDLADIQLLSKFNKEIRFYYV